MVVELELIDVDIALTRYEYHMDILVGAQLAREDDREKRQKGISAFIRLSPYFVIVQTSLGRLLDGGKCIILKYQKEDEDVPVKEEKILYILTPMGKVFKEGIFIEEDIKAVRLRKFQHKSFISIEFDGPTLKKIQRTKVLMLVDSLDAWIDIRHLRQHVPSGSVLSKTGLELT